eukprot:1156009-Pelagomonas_calceolata.AAC.6
MFNNQTTITLQIQSSLSNDSSILKHPPRTTEAREGGIFMPSSTAVRQHGGKSMLGIVGAHHVQETA